jgi:two-component system, NarL family, sensor histidine kinase DesK
VITAPAAGDRMRRQDQDPWDRYGWIFAAVWLVFLIFPIVDILGSDRPGRAQLLSLLAIGLYAATYIRAFVLIGRVETWPEVRSVGIRHGLTMITLALIVGAATGVGALGMAPFVVSLGMFSLRLVEAMAVAVASLALVVAVPFLAGRPEDAVVYFSIVLGVALTTGTVRIVEDRTDERRQHQDQLALMAERDRVARDVHDVLGHSLTVVTVKAELAQRLVSVDPARAQAELAEIQVLTRQALAEIRSTVAGLRIVRLTNELESAATALAGAGIAAHLPDDAGVVDPRHRPVLAWALRESVTNVVRHSHANTCRVEVGANWLTVADDGRGLDGQPEGGGLRGLRDRVMAAGGTVAVEPGNPGTRIAVTL